MTLRINPTPEVWSKKEIFDHLIDSATNNHQRFVRRQFENIPSISYQQDNWVASSRYNAINSQLLISFWCTYNQMIVEIIQRIPEENLQLECKSGGEQKNTIEWLFINETQFLPGKNCKSN